MARGIGDIPLDLPPQHYNVLRDMREMILELRGSLAPPAVPTNVIITPQAFSNLVQFTQANNADLYEVRHSLTANAYDPSAVTVDIGRTNQWTDQVGNSGITKTYWVRSLKNSGARSLWAGPFSGTTLVSTAGVTPPTPPPAGQTIVKDQTTGHTLPGRENQL